MTILGIETSCDETAVSVVIGAGGLDAPRFRVLAQVVASQIKIHAPYGGVVPMLAKREHSKNLTPVLKKALEKSKLISHVKATPWKSKGVAFNSIQKILEREPELLEQFSRTFLKNSPRKVLGIPKIDAIAVTHGPGLEPALWTGINFAKALATVWRKPLIPINHLEGHVLSVLTRNLKATPQGLSLGQVLKDSPLIKFPALSLIISGGHTELVLIRDWFKYRIIGQTRDDAVGEAFDKVARLLDLPYPGGPALAALADKAAKSARGLSLGQVLKDSSPWAPLIKLPRPMIDSPDLDFSFSGLKTAVLYLIKKIPRVVLDKRSDFKGTQGPTLGGAIAVEFQQAVIDVLIRKTTRAIELYQPRTVIVAGGVSANQELKRQMAKSIDKLETPPVLLMPPPALATDNATMIAMAGYLRLQGSTLKIRPKVEPLIKIRASGRLVLK